MAHFARFRISPLKTIQINWPHVFAFLLSVAGIVIAALQHDLTTHSAITWTALGLTVAGPIWQLFLQSILQTNLPPFSSGALGGTVDDRTIPAPPPVMKFERTQFDVPMFAWASVLLCGLMATVVVPLGACTPADQAVETKIEQTVLTDFLAGKSLPQIEADVAALVAGQPGADVVAIVNDALGLLIDLGLVPAQDIPRAGAMRIELQAHIPAAILENRR